MSHAQHDDSSSPAPIENQAAAKSPSRDTSGAVPISDVDPSKPVHELTPEEQMALYEKELKEDDWGHQPC